MGFFASLMVLDVIILFLQSFFALTSKGTDHDYSLYALITTICVPFFVPFHIVILTQLLDLFKEEVLRPTPKGTATSHRNNIAHTASASTGSKPSEI